MKAGEVKSWLDRWPPPFGTSSDPPPDRSSTSDAGRGTLRRGSSIGGDLPRPLLRIPPARRMRLPPDEPRSEPLRPSFRCSLRRPALCPGS